MDVAAQVEVERLALADERRAVGGELDHPALIDLERGAEHGLLVVAQVSRCCTEPSCSRIDCQVSSVFEALAVQHFLQRADCAPLNEPDSVLCV